MQIFRIMKNLYSLNNSWKNWRSNVSQHASLCFGFSKLGTWLGVWSQRADFVKFAYLLGLILFLNGFLSLLQFFCVLSNFWFKAAYPFLKANSFHKVLRKFTLCFPLLRRGIGGKKPWKLFYKNRKGVFQILNCCAKL